MTTPTAETPTRVVVIGAGMVGHRFADEVARLDRAGRVSVDLVGAEAYEPYNRILLSDVVAGRAAWRSLTLSRLPERVRSHAGSTAVRVDRDRRTVVLSDGGSLPYDRLVLATGARAFVPPLAGLEESPRHVHVLRDLDDTRAIVARAANARHAVVLGGGVLGLEAACGLAGRGLAVTVVQNENQLMAGQLDAAPAAVLTAALERQGIRVRLGVSVAEVISAYGELVAVRLTDDTVMSSDLMVVSCGIRPDVALAREAGLTVDRGVVVGADLASPDDALVHAIGDCAQDPAGVTGLVAPGWRQADRLARLVTGHREGDDAEQDTDRRFDIRLKAVGIDLVALGVRPSQAAAGDRVIAVDDPQGLRHFGLVLRGDRLVGATCLGAPEVAAELSVLLDRGTPLPLDPLALLTPERRTEEASPVRMPSTTVVCRCNNVTKRDLVTAWEQGADSVEKVASRTRATTGCGGCSSVVCGIVDWLAASDPGTAQPPVEPRGTTSRGTRPDPEREPTAANS